MPRSSIRTIRFAKGTNGWDRQRKPGSLSGQAGFFCSSISPPGQTGEHGDHKTFYGRCCDTSSGRDVGTADGRGLVSSSGIGDGAYPVEVYGRDGVATKLVPTFIGDDGLDELGV